MIWLFIIILLIKSINDNIHFVRYEISIPFEQMVTQRIMYV